VPQLGVLNIQVGVNLAVNALLVMKVTVMLMLRTVTQMVPMMLVYGKLMISIGLNAVVVVPPVIHLLILNAVKRFSLGVEIHGDYGQLVKFVDVVVQM